MNQIIAMNNEVTMSSREIAELVGKEHKHVMRDLRVLSEQLGDMFEGVVQIWTHPQNKQQYEEYAIKRDTCITLLTGYDSVSRMKVIKRWQELEAEQKPAIPQTYAAALLEAGRLAMELEQAEAKLAIAAPKVDAYDRVIERGYLMNASQVAQQVGMSAIKMNKKLDELGGVYNKNIKRCRTFCHSWVEDGLGEMKVSGDGYTQALFTTKGSMMVVEMFTSEGVI
jgi:phage regulator Rha-like protein